MLLISDQLSTAIIPSQVASCRATDAHKLTAIIPFKLDMLIAELVVCSLVVAGLPRGGNSYLSLIGLCESRD